MKALLFDFEDGSKVLGSEKEIEKIFEYPVLRPPTWDAFTETLTSLYTFKNTIVTKKIGSLEIKETQPSVVLKNGTEVNAIILDTFSELSKKYQRSLTDKDGKMKMQNWGKMKNKLDLLLEFISKMPGIVILNVHSKIKDLDDGETIVLPYIDGSTKEDISKWFDFVFYTRAITTPNGKTKYVWHTRQSSRYINAKDRTQLLDDEIPQDFQIVLEAAREKQYKSCKILVIGSPGSGKTLALKTLVRKEKNGD